MGYDVTEVQKALKGVDYPADGSTLAETAKGNGAPDDLVQALSGIREVDGPTAVMHEIKGALGGD